MVDRSILAREFCWSQCSTSSTILQTLRVSRSTQYTFSCFGHTLAPRFARMARLHCICQSTDLTLLLLSSCSWQRQQSYIAGGIVYGVCLQQCYTISHFRRPIDQRLRTMKPEVLTVRMRAGWFCGQFDPGRAMFFALPQAKGY